MDESMADGHFKAPVAPGQYLGYSLQLSRLLDHLLEVGPGATVSLEVIGDTAVEIAGGVVVEESKSRITNANPIADRSEELWKTFHNWIAAVQAGSLDPIHTKFRLYVSREFEGVIVSRFNDAKSEYEALAALDAARRDLVPVGAPGPSLEENESHRPHLKFVLAADPAILSKIIQNFELGFGSGRTLDDLRKALETRLVPPELANEVLNQSLGWLKTKTDAQIESGEPATVLWDEFRSVVTTIVRRLDRRDFLASVAKEPSRGHVEEHLNLRTYVHQLTLIEVDDDDKIRAVTDYIKAEADRVDWADKGRVIESSFDDFEEELEAAWGNYRRQTELAHKSLPPIERGQMLYSECFGHSSKLAGSDVPEHFCRGSFHRLSDDQDVGWHPDYSTLLTLTEPAAPAASTSSRNRTLTVQREKKRGTRRSKSGKSAPTEGGDGGKSR